MIQSKAMGSSLTRTTPRQVRAAQTRDRILDAVEGLLATQTPESLTARQVAAAAHVPVGSLYRYFASVDGALAALFDRLNSETLKALEAEPHSDWRAHLAQVMSVLARLHRKHPLYGALLSHLPKLPASEDSIAKALKMLLAQPQYELTKHAIEAIATALMAMIDGVEREFHRSEAPGNEALFAEAERALAAYLATYLDD